MAHVSYNFCWNPLRNLRDIAKLSFWHCPKSPKRQFTDLNNSKNTDIYENKMSKIFLIFWDIAMINYIINHEKKNYHVFFFIVTYDIRKNERNWWRSLLRSSDPYRQWLLSGVILFKKWDAWMPTLDDLIWNDSTVIRKADIFFIVWRIF